MKKLHITVILLSSIFLSIHCSCKVRAEDTYCNTRYPIVLVHGLGFRDDAPLIKYWGKIPLSSTQPDAWP